LVHSKLCYFSVISCGYFIALFALCGHIAHQSLWLHSLCYGILDQKTKRHRKIKIGVNVSQAGVTGVSIFSLKGQRSGLGNKHRLVWYFLQGVLPVAMAYVSVCLSITPCCHVKMKQGRITKSSRMNLLPESLGFPKFECSRPDRGC